VKEGIDGARASFRGDTSGERGMELRTWTSEVVENVTCNVEVMPTMLVRSFGGIGE